MCRPYIPRFSRSNLSIALRFYCDRKVSIDRLPRVSLVKLGDRVKFLVGGTLRTWRSLCRMGWTRESMETRVSTVLHRLRPWAYGVPRFNAREKRPDVLSNGPAKATFSPCRAIFRFTTTRRAIFRSTAISNERSTFRRGAWLTFDSDSTWASCTANFYGKWGYGFWRMYVSLIVC